MASEEADQRRLKAELVAAANEVIGNDAIAVGDFDLKLGVEYLKTIAAEHKLPLINANIVGAADGKPVFTPHLVKQVCGTKVGIFSVLMALGPNGKPLLSGPNYRVEDPFETAKKEVAALEASGAVVIVALTHLGLQDDLRLAREVPRVNFIFGSHSMSQLIEPQHVGSTWIFQAGYKGKHVGRADFDFAGPLPAALSTLSDVSNLDRVKERILTYEERIAELTARLTTEPDPDRKVMITDQVTFYREQLEIEKKDLPQDGTGSRLKNSLAELSRDVPDEPKVGELVTKALEAMAALPPMKDPGSEEPVVEPKGPETGPYVGVAVCQACHLKEYTTWASTGHSRAYKTLVEENHQMDFDCVGCHTTGYKKEGGPKDPFTVAGLANVQCEVCHGAGRAHATSPKTVDMRVAFSETDCRGCHSQEQTGDRFVFSQYIPKVDHGKSAAAKKADPKTPGGKPGKGK